MGIPVEKNISIQEIEEKYFLELDQKGKERCKLKVTMNKKKSCKNLFLMFIDRPNGWTKKRMNEVEDHTEYDVISWSSPATESKSLAYITRDSSSTHSLRLSRHKKTQNILTPVSNFMKK